jgi:urocanate hydratase
MSLVALHNGGGVGIGRAINGGFGLVLDGSPRVDAVIKRAISWDVMGGVARRAWAGNENAVQTSIAHNQTHAGRDHITLPHMADAEMLNQLVTDMLKKK